MNLGWNPHYYSSVFQANHADVEIDVEKIWFLSVIFLYAAAPPALDGSMFAVYLRVTAIPCAACFLGATHGKNQVELSGPLLAVPRR